MKVHIDTDKHTIEYFDVEYIQDFLDFPKLPNELNEYTKKLDLRLSCKKKQEIFNIATKQINNN